jgi:hypothetical protein
MAFTTLQQVAEFRQGARPTRAHPQIAQMTQILFFRPSGCIWVKIISLSHSCWNEMPWVFGIVIQFEKDGGVATGCFAEPALEGTEGLRMTTFLAVILSAAKNPCSKISI